MEEIKLGEKITLNEHTVVNPITPEEQATGQVSFRHQYFKTVFFRRTEPYTQLPFFLKNYNRRSKKFHILVLTDKRELDYVPLDYPAVPITEEEAQQIVEHIRSTSKPNKEMQLSELNPQPGAADSTPEAAAPKKKREKDGRVSMRQLANQGFAEGKSQDEIVAAIKAVYSEKDEKKIRGLVSLYRYHKKQADKKAAEAAAAPTPAPAAA